MEIKVLASGSKGNAYTVDDGRTKLLIECGLPWKEIQKRTRFTAGLAACLVSHEHKDHCRAYKEVMAAGIDLYATAGTLDALNANTHRAKAIKTVERFYVGTWAIMAIPTEHDATAPCGFLLVSKEGFKCLYATDTFYLRYKFKDLTHIMLECNYSMDILRQNVKDGRVDLAVKNRVIKSHMSLETVKEFLRANDLRQVQEIHLLHLSDQNSNAEQFKRVIEGVTGRPVIIAG